MLIYSNSIKSKGMCALRTICDMSSYVKFSVFSNPNGFFVSVPNEHNHGFIYAKIHGSFEKIRTSVFSVFSTILFPYIFAECQVLIFFTFPDL